MGCGSIDPGLPDIHGAIGLAAVRHVPYAFPPHEHIGNAANDRPDDIGRAVGPAGSGGALSDVPDFRDGTGRGGADLCDAGYRRDVEAGGTCHRPYGLQCTRTTAPRTKSEAVIKNSIFQKNLRWIFEDRFSCEEGVYRAYTTDEQGNIDRKDKQIHQLPEAPPPPKDPPPKPPKLPPEEDEPELPDEEEYPPP